MGRGRDDLDQNWSGKAVSIDKETLSRLFVVCFDAKMAAEDALALERAGLPSGYKKGVAKAKLARADEMVQMLNDMLD